MGLSQRGLGLAAGLDPTVASPRVNQYEAGKHTPDVKTLAMLGKVLKKPLSYFYEADDALAEAIVLLAEMSARERKNVLERLRSQS